MSRRFWSFVRFIPPLDILTALVLLIIVSLALWKPIIFFGLAAIHEVLFR